MSTEPTLLPIFLIAAGHVDKLHPLRRQQRAAAAGVRPGVLHAAGQHLVGATALRRPPDGQRRGAGAEADAGHGSSPNNRLQFVLEPWPHFSHAWSPKRAGSRNYSQNSGLPFPMCTEAALSRAASDVPVTDDRDVRKMNNRKRVIIELADVGVRRFCVYFLYFMQNPTFFEGF